MATEIKTETTDTVEADMSKLFGSDGENEESQIIIPKKMKKEEPENIKMEESDELEEIEIEDEPEEIKKEETKEIKTETEEPFLRRSGRAAKKSYVKFDQDSDSDTMNEQTPDVSPLKSETFENMSLQAPSSSPKRQSDFSDDDDCKMLNGDSSSDYEDVNKKPKKKIAKKKPKSDVSDESNNLDVEPSCSYNNSVKGNKKPKKKITKKKSKSDVSDESNDLYVEPSCSYDNSVNGNKKPKKKTTKIPKLPKSDLRGKQNTHGGPLFFIKGDPVWYIAIKKYPKKDQKNSATTKARGIKGSQISDLSNLPPDEYFIIELRVAYEDTTFPGKAKKYMTKCTAFGVDKSLSVGHEFLHEYNEEDENLKKLLIFFKHQIRRNNSSIAIQSNLDVQIEHYKRIYDAIDDKVERFQYLIGKKKLPPVTSEEIQEINDIMNEVCTIIYIYISILCSEFV